MGTVRSHHLLIGAVLAVTVLAGSICLGADEAAVFERAYLNFMAYQPEKAVEGFTSFIRDFPQSSAIDAAFFWKAKALAQAGRADEARGIISSFGEKFPESPFRQFTAGALSEMKDRGGARNTEPRVDRNNKGGRAVAEKLKAMEARIAGLERENRAAKKSLADASAEKGRLVKDLQEARQKATDLSATLSAAEAGRSDRDTTAGERDRLGARVSELESRLAVAAEDKRLAEEKARVLALERDDALASGRSGSERASPMPAAGGAVMEREKELREFNEYVRRVKDLESEKKALQDRWEKYRQEKEKELKDLMARGEGAQRKTPAADRQEQVVTDLQKRLAEAEQRSRESAAREKAAAEEKALLASRLKEAEQGMSELASAQERGARRASETARQEQVAADLQKRLAEAEQQLAAMAALRNTVEQERSKARKAVEERDRLLEEMNSVSKPPAGKGEGSAIGVHEDASALKNRELTAENAALRERLALFERPAVRIAGKTYSQAEIEGDRAVAARVLGRIGQAPVSWQSGNAFEDFVAERVLASRAGKADLQAAADGAAALGRKYSLGAQEQGYLLRFLAADAVVKRRREYPRDEDLRNYYDAHRNEFAARKGERIVQYLTLRQGSGDKAAGVQLVSDLQREAMAGRPLEEIARGRGGRVGFTRSRMAELPAWIREKVKRIRVDAISSIFTEDQFILLQVVEQREVQEFDEVKAEIRNRLTKGAQDVDAWLAAARREAEDLR